MILPHLSEERAVDTAKSKVARTYQDQWKERLTAEHDFERRKMGGRRKSADRIEAGQFLCARYPIKEYIQSTNPYPHSLPISLLTLIILPMPAPTPWIPIPRMPRVPTCRISIPSTTSIRIRYTPGHHTNRSRLP